MSESDYDHLAELLCRFDQRARANGCTAEYVRLCSELEQRRALYALDTLVDCATGEVYAVTDKGMKA